MDHRPSQRVGIGYRLDRFEAVEPDQGRYIDGRVADVTTGNVSRSSVPGGRSAWEQPM